MTKKGNIKQTDGAETGNDGQEGVDSTDGAVPRNDEREGVDSRDGAVPCNDEREGVDSTDCHAALAMTSLRGEQKNVIAREAPQTSLRGGTTKQSPKRVPQLRFKEFDYSWTQRTVGYVCNMKAGSYIKASEIYDEELEGMFPCYGGNGLRGFTKTHNQEGKYTLIGRQGAHCGNVKLADGKFYATEHAVVVSLSDKYDADWIFYLLYNSNLNQYSTGQAQPGLSVKNLEKVGIIVPTLPEQQKIASFLSAVDKKIQQLSKKKALLEDYKKGVMQQLFSQQLRFRPTKANKNVIARTKDEAISPSEAEFPDWEEKRLREVGKIVSGLTYSPDDIDESGVLVLRSSNVHGRQVTFGDNVYVNVIDGKFNPVEENDILICVRNGSKRLIGKNALITGKAIGVAFGAFMTVYRSLSNLFLFHYFDTVDYKKEVHKNLGATINSINGSDLKKFKIPFPSLSEQQKIATYLSSIDTKIETVNQQINKTQGFKKGLLQRMFV